MFHIKPLDPRTPFTRRQFLFTGTAVLTVALITWVVTVQRMRGMDAGSAPSAGSSASG